jgi:hypothetical protein
VTVLTCSPRRGPPWRGSAGGMDLLPDPVRGRVEEAAMNRHPRGHGEPAGGAGASGGLDVKTQRRLPCGGGARGLRATTVENDSDERTTWLGQPRFRAEAGEGASGGLPSLQ